MSYNGFHNTWGYPKDITYHGMKQYVTLAVDNMNCGCCSSGCKCSEKKEDKEPEIIEEEKPKADEGCTDKPLEDYIDNTSIDEPSDFEKPCSECTKVTEKDESEPLCTNECMSHTSADEHIDNIMKEFKNLGDDDVCPMPKR